MNIYCINLKRSVNRRKTMSEEFQRQGIPVEFIDAVDGRALSKENVKKVYSKWRTLLRTGKSLLPGEIGCALSHVEFYKKVIVSNSPGFVFEDDVLLNAETKKALCEASCALQTEQPTVFRIPGCQRDLPQSMGGYRLTLGTYAYGINVSAAKLLLKAYTPIRMPSDGYDYLKRCSRLNIQVYPGVAVSVDLESESTIEDTRFPRIGRLGKVFYKLWRCFGVAIDRMLPAI